MDFQWFLVTMLLPGVAGSAPFPWLLERMGSEPGWALQQSPDTIVRVGDTVTLECSGLGNVVKTMYWYKLPVEKDVSMQLVVYSVEGGKADIEKEFKNRFQSNGTRNNHLSVKIQHALLNDTGTYFCAE
ncbi:hypothetical protein DV515_00020054, partial [Chloebia gouldiae]